MTPSLVAATSPVTRRVRAYFAPVDRSSEKPTIFDPSRAGSFDLDAPPSPWIDLGWCEGFTRHSGTKIQAIQSGAPAITQAQVRAELDATLSLQFTSWGKLQLALTAESQQMNLLHPAPAAAANGSGGSADAAIAIAADGASTATQLSVGAAQATAFQVGDLVAVDIDYTGQTGFVGSGVAGGYVRSPASVGEDTNYIRRITLNVARIVAIDGGLLQLGAPLLAGNPAPDMKVSRLAGFVDRGGGSFFQEWSGLFVMQGEQGDRILYHYPRLQTMQGTAEDTEPLIAPLEQVRLTGSFRALPITDTNDGETVLYFRSYLPAAMRFV